MPSELPPRRVFLSHTSELRRFPVGRSFVSRAAQDAVISTRYGHCVFPRAAWKPARVCREAGRGGGCLCVDCRVPCGAVPPAAAAQSRVGARSRRAGIPRLVFLLGEDTEGPAALFGHLEHGARAHAFRLG